MNHLAHGAHLLTLTNKGFLGTASINYGEKNGALLIGHSVEAPLFLRNQSSCPLRIMVAKDAAVHLVLDGAGDAIDVTLEDNSSCTLYRAPFTDNAASSKFMGRLAQNAQLKFFDFGFANASHETIIELAGARAQFAYFGLDQLHGDQKKDAVLTIKHVAEDSVSSQWFRGVYGGESRGSFVGTVIVEKDAQNAKAHQLYKAVIVSEKAKAHVKPELVIYNHDISASHGASIGELDSEALFFLCSRGIALNEARALLLEGFVGEVLDQIEMPTIKAAMHQASLTATARLLGDPS